MAINAEIKPNNNESTGGVMRRFSRKVKSSGVIRKSKSLRYSQRKMSKTMQKKQTLRSLKKRAALEKLIKLGKIKDKRRKPTPILRDEEKK